MFEPEAMEAIARRAREREIGARGLRTVMEGLMTQIMYDIPSDLTIKKVTVTRACVEDGEQPLIERDVEHPRQAISRGTHRNTQVS